MTRMGARRWGRDRSRGDAAVAGMAAVLLLFTAALWGCGPSGSPEARDTRGAQDARNTQDARDAQDAQDARNAPPHEGRLLVLAASDLVVAMPELVRLFEDRHGGRVDVVLGSSGNLAAQVEAGAPADLYLSANRAFVDRLDERGRLLPGTRREYAVGRLALVTRPGRPVPDGLAALADPEVAAVALANPDHAPYGTAAREALESAGLWERLGPRLVYAENVAQVTQFVRTGNADAGLVALGVILGERDWPHYLVPAELHQPLVQAGAVVRDSAHPARAGAFLDLMVGDEGQAVLARYGFEPPPHAAPAAPRPDLPPGDARTSERSRP